MKETWKELLWMFLVVNGLCLFVVALASPWLLLVALVTWYFGG